MSWGSRPRSQAIHLRVVNDEFHFFEVVESIKLVYCWQAHQGYVYVVLDSGVDVRILLIEDSIHATMAWLLLVLLCQEGK